MNSFSCKAGLLEEGLREEDTDGRVAAELARFLCLFCARSHRSCSDQLRCFTKATKYPPSFPYFSSD